MAKSFKDLPGAVQALILGTVAVLLAGGAFYYYVWPLSAQRERLEAEVNRLHAENVKNQAVERDQAELLARIADLGRQLETRRTIVPDEQATDEFVKMVYDTATASAINVRTFVAQALVTREFYVEMPFSMRIDGVYYAMLNYFDRLARQQRIVSVTNLGLGPPAGGGMGNYKIHPNETVGANCVVVTYFNRPQPPAPAPTKK